MPRAKFAPSAPVTEEPARLPATHPERRLSFYGAEIESLLANRGETTINPRHVEAFMLCEHETLDALSPAQFAAEVRLAVECIQTGGTRNAEALAASFGL